MRKTSLKQILLLLVILLPDFWCNANSIYDGYSAIQVKEASVQHTPKGSSIQAYIDGHNLTIVFTENLGQVEIAITTSMGVPVETLAVVTPNGTVFYIPLPGDYIVNFTLPNGDEYYGEFTVTD